MPLVALMALGLIALDLIIYFITPRLKPLLFFAAVMLAAAVLALASYGCRRGLVLARYEEPPRETDSGDDDGFMNIPEGIDEELPFA